MEQFERDGRLYYTKSGMPCYKRYLDEMPGVPLQDVWTDLPPALGAQDLGYPTQKPLALLERIIQASSNEGDVVLDPFCGCGTAIIAAHKLKRRWVGIDITHLSIALMKYRLKDAFGLEERKDYAVIGEPEDLADARQLAHDDRYQFQWWALSLVHARPLGGPAGAKSGKKGSDKGVDGVISIIEEGGKPRQILVQVKSGHVKSGDVRDLVGAVDRESAALGLFVTLEEPSRDMLKEAATAGFYQTAAWGEFPRIQVLTIEQLLAGARFQTPPAHGTFKQASKDRDSDGRQGRLEL